ncbi:ketopantoate reductase family protein [Mycobacterium sp. SMC-4]|uniref:ketopantoate reductase family protein n=1 Tax=Mycobacterium sp. SMC-4 TaxID=2857059 RepID=UPI003D053616
MNDHRYVIVGAGAVGGAVGGMLARSGSDAILVGRGAHGAALAERGLLLRTPDGAFEIAVPAATGPDDVRLTTRDVLVFATKTHQLGAALQDWADRPVHDGDAVVGTAGDVLPVLTALNGVVAEEMALRLFARVFGVCVWMPAAHVTPGEAIVRSWPMAGQFHIARWPASLTTADDTELLREIAQTWTPAGIQILLPADVAPWKYNKLLSNLTNSVVALTGSYDGMGTVGDAVLAEGEQVLERAGIPYIPFSESDAARADGLTMRPVPGADGVIPNSTWQSLARNTGGVETDFLNGEIVRIAHSYGGTAPINAGLARLARDAARHGSAPGQYTREQLKAMLIDG